MLYLLWGILNIGLLVIVFIMVLKPSVIVSENYKWPTRITGIVLLGLNIMYNNRQASLESRKWTFPITDSVDTTSTDFSQFLLEKSLFTKLGMTVVYGKDKQQQSKIPLSATSSDFGFVSGINWLPTSITVQKTPDSTQYRFRTEGILQWKLVGITIIAQPKEFTGPLPVN